MKTQHARRTVLELQVRICERAEREIKDWQEHVERSSFLMDLDSIPELDLPKLLVAPRFDFAHDCCGIRRHMDRSNFPGKLTDCFWPRCAHQTEGAQ